MQIMVDLQNFTLHLSIIYAEQILFNAEYTQYLRRTIIIYAVFTQYLRNIYAVRKYHNSYNTCL